MPDFDPASCGIGFTMLFFRNNTTIQYFSSACELPSLAQLTQFTDAIAFASTALDLPLGCAKLVSFYYKFIFYLIAALKR